MYNNVTKAGKAIDKAIKEHIRLNRYAYEQTRGDMLNDDLQETMREIAFKHVVEQERKYIRYGLLMGEVFMEEKQKLINEGLITDPSNAKRTYSITLRPNDTLVTFSDFFDMVKKITERKCFERFKASFEQKCTDPNDVNNLGKGFHVHIYAKMKQKSKGEVLRDFMGKQQDDGTWSGGTLSNWINKNFIAANCIKIKPCTDDVDKTFKQYCIDYNSKDEHKVSTKECDALWREQNDIEPFYEDSIYSASHQVRVEAQKKITLGGPTIVELS